MRTKKKQLYALLDRLEPEVRDAFLQSFQDIKNNANLDELITLLAAGNINGAFDALQMQRASFRALDRQIGFAFEESGELALKNRVARGITGGRVVLNFDVRNIRAEKALAEISSRLITEIISDQREGIRNYLSTDLSVGQSPKKTAIELVGSYDRVAKRRVGGIVGLNSNQMRYVQNMRAELADPALMANYFTRARRDKRFDGVVRRAIMEEKPLSVTDIDKLTTRYSDKLLQLRGETIARTETIGALNTAQEEAFKQAIDAGAARPSDVKKIWRTANDSRVRDSHAAMEGETVGIDERFSNGLLYPAEAGGDPAEVINCRCIVEYDIDFLAGLND